MPLPGDSWMNREERARRKKTPPKVPEPPPLCPTCDRARAQHSMGEWRRCRAGIDPYDVDDDVA